MAIRFTKMQGIGNDYIFVDAMQEHIRDASRLAVIVSDRHFGIGSDGLILACPPEDSRHHCRMEMYNADGSRAQMCGNGIRCLARFVYERDIAPLEELAIETDAGVKTVRLDIEDGEFRRAIVDMGVPCLDRASLPMVDGQPSGDPAISIPFSVDGKVFEGTIVSVGNPHNVIRLDQDHSPIRGPLENLDLRRWGPLFENHPWFPERVNTEFIHVLSRGEIDMRVWERGSGETLACGTGACAVTVAAVVNDWCDRRLIVHLRGGDLEIEWLGEGDDGHVMMSGPAEPVFDGEF